MSTTNPFSTVTLAAVRDVVIDAGTRRDGSAAARCETALAIITLIGFALYAEQPVGQPNSDCFRAIGYLRNHAANTLSFCLVQ